VNRAHELHQIQLLKLDAGRSAEDFPNKFPGSTSLLPKWIKHMGGPNGIIPGEKTSATLYLEWMIYPAQATLESKLVAQTLSDVGLTSSEVQERLARLTDD
jgi:hypothetical protein